MKTNTLSTQISGIVMTFLITLILFLGFTKLVESSIFSQVQPEIQSGIYVAGKEAVRGTSQNINNALENVKDKLNLDEPIPKSTKDFLANPLAKLKDQNPSGHPVGFKVLNKGN